MFDSFQIQIDNMPRGKYTELAGDLLKKKALVTSPMLFGIDNMGVAADKYVTDRGVDIHPVGIVINPSAAYLGCSSNRRLFDPEETPHSTHLGIIGNQVLIKGQSFRR